MTTQPSNHALLIGIALALGLLTLVAGLLHSPALATEIGLASAGGLAVIVWDLKRHPG